MGSRSFRPLSLTGPGRIARWVPRLRHPLPKGAFWDLVVISAAVNLGLLMAGYGSFRQRVAHAVLGWAFAVLVLKVFGAAGFKSRRVR